MNHRYEFSELNDSRKLGDNAYALRNALFAHFRLCRNEAASIARSVIFAKLRVSTEVETSISKKISLFS